MRVLAELLAPVEAETPFGGRLRSYEPLGVVWLEPGRRRWRERTEAGTTRRSERRTATARVDPRLAEGRLLRFGGADWAIGSVEPGPEGRVIVELERSR